MDRWLFDLDQPLPGERPDAVSPITAEREMEAFQAFTSMM